MRGLDPRIHVDAHASGGVDRRVKPGDDDPVCCGTRTRTSLKRQYKRIPESALNETRAPLNALRAGRFQTVQIPSWGR